MGDDTRTLIDGTAPSRKIWAAITLLVLATSAAYANSFHGPFVFDDTVSITTNRSIRHLASLQVLVAPPDAVTTTGRPLVNLSLAINYAIGGLAVQGYHVGNLALHILAALVLFGLFRRTLLLPTVSARFGAASAGLALTVALLWAIHPLQTESVTYVVQRAESIVGLFYLLTLYCVLRGATAVRGGVWYAAAIAACALGMASKEVMVTAPALALLYDRVFIAGSFKESLRRRRGLWLGLAATWGFLVLVFQLSSSRGGSAGFGLGMTPWQYARTQFGCIIHYLRLVFWPSPLVLDYGYPVARTAAEIVPYAIGVFALLAATAAALVLRPKWGFLGLWFFAILAPSSSIVPLVGQTEAEHRMYLPLAAVVALVVLGAYQLGKRFGLRSGPTALVAAVAALLAWGTFRRNKDYQTELALWDGAVRHCPWNDRAYNNRGNAYVSKHQYAAAIPDFDKAIALNPRYVKAYSGRGNAFIGLGRYDEAIRDHSKAIRLMPSSADAYNCRGSAYGNVGQFDAAIKDFDKAISLDVNYDEAYCNRGTAYESKGQIDAAIKDYDKAIELWPEYAVAYNSRGMAYDSKGQYDSAIRDYDSAIRLRSDYAEAYNNRGSAYEAKGQLEAAAKDFDKAIALQPDGAQAYSNRGNVYQSKGLYQAAIKDYGRAIELKPDLAAAYRNRAIARYQIKAYDQAWADVRTFRKLGGTFDARFIEDLSRQSGRTE